MYKALSNCCKLVLSLFRSNIINKEVHSVFPLSMSGISLSDSGCSCTLMLCYTVIAVPLPAAVVNCVWHRGIIFLYLPYLPAQCVSSLSSIYLIVSVRWYRRSGGGSERDGEREDRGLKGAKGCYYPPGSMGALCQWPQWAGGREGQGSSTLS